MTAATELLIARHGEAHCNVDQVVGGPIGCTGLTDLGRSQVELLAQRLQTEHARRAFAALVTTPLRRTLESATVIAHALGLTPDIEPDLAEAHYGSADGQPWADVVHTFDGIPSQEPHRAVAPGAETWAAYLGRAQRALAELLDRYDGERILIVGHGETVVAAAHHFLGLPADATARVGFAAYPASVTRWAQQPASWVRPELGWRWALTQHNDATHLGQGDGT